MKRTLSYLVLLLLPVALMAATEKKELNFTVDSEALLKGGLDYSFTVVSPATIYRDYPGFEELDSQGLLKKKGSTILLSKFAFVAHRPVGFFDDQIDNQVFLTQLLGNVRLQRLGEGKFKVQIKNDPTNYVLQNYVDSDDISTVSHPRVAKAILAVKRLDVLAQSASFLIFQEMTRFSVGMQGAVQVSAYIPLKENRTLIVGYRLVSVKKYANDSALKSDLAKEYQSIMKLLNRPKD